MLYWVVAVLGRSFSPGENRVCLAAQVSLALYFTLYLVIQVEICQITVFSKFLNIIICKTLYLLICQTVPCTFLNHVLTANSTSVIKKLIVYSPHSCKKPLMEGFY